MRQIVSGTFAGIGAALSFGIGFSPDRVEVFREDASTVLPALKWEKELANTALAGGGIKVVSGTPSVLAAGAGISTYAGSEKLAAASTTILVKKAGGTYDFEGAPAGDVVPQGFKIDETAVVNLLGKKCYFIAECYN